MNPFWNPCVSKQCRTDAVRETNVLLAETKITGSNNDNKKKKLISFICGIVSVPGPLVLSAGRNEKWKEGGERAEG